jgi:hypothetical protein
MSAVMFFYYFEAVCQKNFRRHFDWGYFRSIVNANWLEFKSLLEKFDAPVDFPPPSAEENGKKMKLLRGEAERRVKEIYPRAILKYTIGSLGYPAGYYVTFRNRWLWLSDRTLSWPTPEEAWLAAALGLKLIDPEELRELRGYLFPDNFPAMRG